MKGERTVLQGALLYDFRVARRISLITFSAGAFGVPVLCLIFVS